MKLLIICSFLFSIQSVSNSQWRLIKRDDDVSVYSKKTMEGYDAIKIDAAINCSMNDFIELINDADQYHYWVYSCTMSNTIEKEGNTLIYEIVTDMPYPIQDRYIKVKSTQVFSSNVYDSHSIAMPAEKEGMVAIDVFDSRWHVETQGENNISIEYIVKTQPGGHITAWLYNMAVDRGPYNTMINMKNKLENKSEKRNVAINEN